jgi:hypothetical protein
MEKILFFGYGANRDKKRIEDILRASGLTGEDLKLEGGFGARVDEMVLAIQNLQQIPETVRETLLKVWGGSFRAYTIKPGVGQIAGVLWGLNQKQFEALKAWEHDGVWREFIEVEITTTDQHKLKAFTDKAINTDDVIQVVDGLNYETNLNLEGMKTPATENDEYRIQEIQNVRQELSKITSA